jgi:hypothetical protein
LTGSGGRTEAEAQAREVQRKAAGLPSPGDVRDLAERAVAHGPRGDMSLDEIRQLAAAAVAQSDEVSALLRRLSALLAGEP